MNLTFVKGSGKFDELTVRRENGTTQKINCPKQGIIPHDMIHYAVESVLAHRGFLSLVAQGQTVGYAANGDSGEEAVERLVETFQAEMWGGRVPAADLIATYEHACGARGHGIVAVSSDEIEAIRARLDDLGRRWADLAVNGTLTLRL